MTRIKTIVSLISIFSLLIARVSGQVTTPVSVTGHVNAEVISAFSASEASQLNFGRFAPGPQGGQIIVTPESTVSVLGSVYKGTGLQNAASFHVLGASGAAFAVTLPSVPVVLKHTSSARTMLVKDWMSIPSAEPGAGMLQNGFQEVYVGATLNVGTINDNPPGIYTGTYSIIFDFN